MPSVEKLRNLQSYPFTLIVNKNQQFNIEMKREPNEGLSIWKYTLP